jgi:hypothetical protein
MNPPTRSSKWRSILLFLLFSLAIIAVREEVLRALELTKKWQDAVPDVRSMNVPTSVLLRRSMEQNTNDRHAEKELVVVDTTNQPRILVVYGGPTDVLDFDIPLDNRITAPQVKQLKYHLNTEYFLKHGGVQCKTQDTLLIVTNKTLHLYQDRIQAMDETCARRYNHRVLITTRENKCLDLEAVRVAVYGGMVNLSTYDYFFYINCGVSGPAKELANLPWTDLFIQKLKNGVKMTGLSHNCPNTPHIQSMMYAMDREALEIVKKKGAIFDCLKKWPDFYQKPIGVAHGCIVNGYERKMGELILEAGYAIDPYLRSQAIFKHNKSNCQGKDLWLGSPLRAAYGGRIPLLNETVFFKSTRFLSPELAEEIGYKAKITGNWGH